MHTVPQGRFNISKYSIGKKGKAKSTKMFNFWGIMLLIGILK